MINTKSDGDRSPREQTWQQDGLWWVGHFNRSPLSVAGLELPQRVTIVDTTLREGEETPGTLLTLDEKVRIAHLIAAMGFREMEVGYAGVIDEHFKLIQRLKAEHIGVRLASHTRIYGHEDEWRGEIDRNVEAGADSLTFVGWATDAGISGTPWLAKDAVASRVGDCIRYAKQHGVHTTFGLADLVRTQARYIDDCYTAAASAGVDRVYVYDGQGAATPHAVAFLTRLVRDIVGPEIEIAFHGHNTFGLSTANAVAALTNGAAVVDTVPNGLGDGAGITATEEIVAALEVLYGTDTGIQIHRLRELCDEVARLLGAATRTTQPVVGDNLYRHQIDSHIAAIVRGAWDSWEVVRPEVLGHSRRLEFGHSKLRRGRSGGIGAIVNRMGVSADDSDFEKIVDAVREIAARHRFASEQEVETVIHSVIDMKRDGSSPQLGEA